MKKTSSLVLRLCSFTILSGTMLFASSGWCAEEELRLSLDDSFRRAMNDNLNLKATALGIRYDDYTIERAQSSFDPALSFRVNKSNSESPNYTKYIPVSSIEQKSSSASLSLGRNLSTGGNLSFGAYNALSESNVESTKNYSGYLGFSFDQPLLKGFGKKNAYANIYLARLSGDATIRSVESSAISLLAQVERAYWTLVYAHQTLNVRSMALAQAESLLAYNEKARDLGVLVESDVLEAKSAFLSRKQEVMEQENQILIAENELKVLLSMSNGSDSNTRLSLTDTPSIIEISDDPASALDMALKTRPDYLSGIVSVEQARIRLDVARNALLPSLGMNASYRLNGSGETFDRNLKRIGERDAYGWAVGLNVSYPIGNKNARAEYQQNNIDLQRTQLNLEALKNRISADIRSGIGKVSTNRRRIEVAKLAVEANELKLRTEEEKFRNRLSTSYLVLQYQTDLANSRNLLNRAIMDYALSVLDLRCAKGTLLKDLNISILPAGR